MYINGINAQQVNSSLRIVVRCPHCGSNGTFENVLTVDVRASESNIVWGLRKCPNHNCNGIIFFIKDLGIKDLLECYPPLRIDFNEESIPQSILQIFKEAISCHSQNCFIAAGMMIRKTLEAICEDKGAKGANLHQKLDSLKKIITVPIELFEAIDELKLLGNDSAHIHAKSFEQIGKEEIEISIEFTQEILKAVYQYQTLLGRLRGLKKQ